MKYVYDPIQGAVVPKGEELVEITTQFIPDSIDVVSLVDNKHYSSKTALRRMYRERGLVEIHGCGLRDEGSFDRMSESSIEDAINKAFERGRQ